MYGKIVINADLELLTGLHIRGSEAFSAIGAVDSPVIKDKRTGHPIIPGSSLKGKMRMLLARSLTNSVQLKSCDMDEMEIKRLFGSGGNHIVKGRLQFSDCFLSDDNSMSPTEVTEVKFENTINRLNSSAMPRQIERVIRGTVYTFVLVYDLDKKDELKEDFDNIAKAMKLLQLDYLGGHGTRGYGRVSFKNTSVKIIEGVQNETTIQKLNETLKEVENYGILSV
ncbi:MAG: type III-A CRISPR-associated RAMP protein Csm3 [Anaerovoracaceae bacterium]